jgi:uncharacterized protein (TIGR03067 family)
MNAAAVTEPRMDPAYEVEKKLQGTWIVESGRWNCQLLFAGHNFALRFASGDVYMGVYAVDPTQSPAVMEMTIDDGPDHFRGLTALCLYELLGDVLRWCGNEPGATERRRQFPVEPESKYPTLVFRRDGI